MKLLTKKFSPLPDLNMATNKKFPNITKESSCRICHMVLSRAKTNLLVTNCKMNNSVELSGLAFEIRYA
jgi:hypothetical protein